MRSSLISVGCVLVFGVACSSEDSGGSDASMTTVFDAGPAPDSGRANPDASTTSTTPPTLESFTANPTSVAPGASTTLSWRVRDADKVTIEATPGVVVHSTSDNSGAFMTAPLGSRTTFTLTATGAGTSVQGSLVVEVIVGAVQVQSFTATPNPGTRGGTAVLAWRTANATRVRVLNGANELFNTTTMLDSGSFTVTLANASQTYTLEASKGVESARQDLVVTTSGDALSPMITTFDVDPLTFSEIPTTATITWIVERADSVVLLANNLAVPGFSGGATGTHVYTATTSTILDLVAANTAGMTTATRFLTREWVESEPNDSRDDADDIDRRGTPLGAAITPGSDVDWFRVDVPGGGSVYAQTSDGVGGCATDTTLTFFDDSGALLGEDTDDGPAPGCSEISPVRDAWARWLSGGTYYVVVQAMNTQAGGSYSLSVNAQGPVCGNGVIDASEQCDDANTSPGDGCNATCGVESAGVAMGPGGAATLFGSISVAGEVDVYTVTMATAGSISVETFAPASPACTADTVVTLSDRFDVLVEDDDDGTNGCSSIHPIRDAAATVPAGVYFVRVRAKDVSATISDYTVVIQGLAATCGDGVLDPGETCDDGNRMPGDGCNALCAFEGFNEAEPNDLTQPNLLNVPGVARGSLDPASDVDVYRISVPAGHHLEAFASHGASFGSCPQPASVWLILYDASGTVQLASDAFSGIGGQCGRLAPDTAMATFAMAGGTYLLAVQEISGNVLPNYFLDVRTVAPGCGNGYDEAAEQCDDGNMMAGDGCSPGCTLEVNQTITPPGGQALLSVSPDSTVVVQVELTQHGQSITATTADSGGGCSVDTRLTLLNATYEVLGDRSFGAVFPCASIKFGIDSFASDLSAGTYFLLLDGTPAGNIELTVGIVNPRCGNGVVESRASEQCDDGNTTPGDGCGGMCEIEGNAVVEIEPNDILVQATDVTVAMSSTVTIVGAVDPAGDLDLFAFDVVQGATLLARTYGTIGNYATCQGDTRLELLDAGGVVVTDDDDGGQVPCSFIDGRLDVAAANLAAGRYYLRVRFFDDMQRIPYYLLDVNLR